MYGRYAVPLFTAIVMAFSVMVGPDYLVQAAGAGCRTDPIFFFSNGDKLSVSMAIGVVPHDVEKIEYIVQAPATTSLERVVTTGPVTTAEATTSPPGSFKVFLPMMVNGSPRATPRAVETYVVHFDQPEGTYSIAAVVYTTKDPVPVTLQVALREYKDSIDGQSGQSLVLKVRP